MRPKKPTKKKGLADLPPKKTSGAAGKDVRGGASDIVITKPVDVASNKIIR